MTVRLLLLSLLLLVPAVALAADPPPGAKIYVYWGHSEARGHDKASNAPRTITHFDHIWRAEGSNAAVVTYDATSQNYFADELIVLGKATDVIMLHCGAVGQWTDGVIGEIKALSACASEVDVIKTKYGAVLAGAITYCCAGDTLDVSKVKKFPYRFDQLHGNFIALTGSPTDLPFIVAKTPKLNNLRCNNMNSTVRSNITKIQKYQAAVDWPKTNVIPSPGRGFRGYNPGSGCYHLSAPEQAALGRNAAANMQ